MSTTRVVYADILRILAIFAVIILHSLSKWDTTPVASFEWQIFNIYDSLARWGVPVFLMLSGMFFLDPEKKISKQDIYGKYILRIVRALVFWGTIYGLGSLLAQRVISHEELSIYNFAKIPAKIIVGPPWYHLWFLYTIIGLYILTPLLRIFIAACSKKDIEYFLVLFILFGAMLPLLNNVIHQMKPSLSGKFMSIDELSGLLGYFIAGYYFSKYDISPLIKNIIYIVAIVSLLLTIVVTSIVSIHDNKTNTFLHHALIHNAMFTSYAIFILIKTELNDFKFKENTASIISYISSCSFGIYLVHDMFNQLFSILKISTLSFNPIFSIPLLSSVNFILSCLVVIAIKKTPILNKNII